MNIAEELKQLEQEFDIVTQNVKANTADKSMNGKNRLTMENIVHKTNLKVGGLNYAIILPNTGFV